ncbi:MAG: 50S ribosomal protein L25 [Candidatus Omnitrophota bacterium]
MEELILEAELREGVGTSKSRGLRAQGFIPAVVYKEGKEAQAIRISSGELIRLLHQHRLENAIVNLKIKGDKSAKNRPCLVKEIQHDPVHGNVIHVDFNEVSLTKVIKVNVPVAAKGDAVGVKQDGGSLEVILWEIEIECLPTNIPEEIPVDVTNLKIGDGVHIRDIIVPAGVKILNELDATVLHVVAPMKEEVPVEAVEGEEKQEPEVIKEKKEAPAEGEAAEGKEKDKEKEKK